MASAVTCCFSSRSLHVIDRVRRGEPAAEEMQNQAREHPADRRYDRPVPPGEARRRVDQAMVLTSEEQLEKADTFAKQHAAERAANADQRRPEDDAGEVLVTEQDQPQPREERERHADDVADLIVHPRDVSAARGACGASSDLAPLGYDVRAQRGRLVQGEPP